MGVTNTPPDARDVWIVRWIDRLRRNVRHAARGLKREPAYALTAILTLGLGTAAMTTVFSVADAELWRPLPFHEPDRLVVVQSSATTPGRADGIGMDELNEWRATMPAFAALSAAGGSQRRAVRLDFTASMTTVSVTANFFTTLGRAAMAGRVFTADEARGSNPVVLGTRAWQRVFDARPDLVGKTVLIDNEPHTIVGVVQTDDSRGPEADLFLPIDESAAAARGGATTFYSVIGRLAPGATREVALAQAQAAVDRRSLLDPTRAGHIASVEDISEHYRGGGRPLYFFLAASVLVLALTIINVAGLTLSRSVRRAPEFALRGALGGGTRAIAGLLAVEAALVAVPGCVLGLWLAAQAVGVVAQMIPSEFLMRGRHIVVDYRAMAMCAGVVAATMAGLALAPLGVARRADGAVAMAGGLRSSGLRSAGKTRERLLVAQMALTVVLLTGSAVFLQNFAAASRVPLGFDPTDGWSMRVSLSDAKYRDDGLVRQYVDSLIARARAIPGVRDAAGATSSPLMNGEPILSSEPGVTLPGGTSGTRTIYRAVTPDYFRTIATPIVRGRGFTASDVAGAPDVAVVNESLVRQVFQDRDPIGKPIELKNSARSTQVRGGLVTIVGVAANIKEAALNEVDFADVYVPLAQRPATGIELLVRGNGSSANMLTALRGVAAATDPAVPVSAISTIDRRVALALQPGRFNLTLVSGFAVVAVLIGAIGIYGAMAYAAVARARGFGVRMALGASPARLLRGALWHAARFGVVGAALGVAAAIGAALWIGDALHFVPGKHNGLLFNVSTTDPLALGTAAAGVIVVALLSGAIPARRLARIDPVKMLRAD